MIIIGLGNPGEEYINTRHNVGFMFLDFLISKLALANFTDEKKFKAQISKNPNITLIKPLTYMNDSGMSVRAYFDFYKQNLTQESFMVAHDDLDIRLGSFKLSRRPPKGHNGLISISNNTGIEEFQKIKIGIDNRINQISGISYVLQKFDNFEIETLNHIFEEIMIKINI